MCLKSSTITIILLGTNLYCGSQFEILRAHRILLAKNMQNTRNVILKSYKRFMNGLHFKL